VVPGNRLGDDKIPGSVPVSTLKVHAAAFHDPRVVRGVHVGREEPVVA